MTTSLTINAPTIRPFENTIARIGANEKSHEKLKWFPIRLGNIFLDYVKSSEGLKATFKTVYHGIDWWKQFASVSPNVQNLRQLTNDGKNVISATEVPGKTVDIGRKLVDVCKQKTLCSIKDLVSSVSQLTGPLVDGIKLAADKKIIHLTPKALSQAAFVSSAGLAIGTSMSAGTEAKKIAGLYEGFQKATSRREYRDNAHQVAKHALYGAKFVSYAALGTVGVTGALVGLVVASWIPLALSTSALVFTILGHFYTKFNNLDERTGDLASKA